MDSRSSAISVPVQRASLSATGGHHPFRRNPDRWGSSCRVGYVGQDQFEFKGGCSQETNSSSKAAIDDAQGTYPDPAWPACPTGAVGEPSRTGSSDALGLSCPTREILFPPASYPPQPATAAAAARVTVPYDHTVSDEISRPYYRRGDGRGANCKVKGCTTPSSYSVDGARPAVLCGNHRDDGMRRVQHDDKTCGHEGCGHPAAVIYMSQDGKIDRFCSDHKMPHVVTTRASRCEHPGCSETPKYGPRDGPMSFCQAHKRTGMYTNRKGQLLIATRDGDAFTSAAAATAFNSSTAFDPKASERASSPQQTAGGSEDSKPSSPQPEKAPSSPPSTLTSLNRKQCEVPGCQIQPSYGLTGTTRPRFCARHKKEGMVGLKNRPCLHPGCNTRPHYGPSRGRPVYCTTHKKRGMVHLLKESMLKKNDKATWKRAIARQASREKKGLALAAATAIKKSLSCGKGKKLGISFVSQGKEKKETARAQGKDGSKVKVSVGAGAGKGVKRECKTGKNAVEMSSSPESSPASPRSISRTAPATGKQKASTAATGDSKTKKKTLSSSSPSLTMPLPGQGATPPPHPSSREADSSGMPPLVEVNVFEKARVSIKAEAEASGSGRRARAPSRKALEAAGLVDVADEGAQWMTKERKEEAARREKEFKEQRRQYKAAGLNVGVVVEACLFGGGGYGRGKGSGPEGENGDWRVLTPAEILQQAKHKSGNRRKRLLDDEVGTTGVVGGVAAAAAGSKQNEGEHDEIASTTKAENVGKGSSAKKGRKRKGTAADSGLRSNGTKKGSVAVAITNHINASTDTNERNAKRSRKQSKQGNGSKDNPGQAAVPHEKRTGDDKPTRVRGGEGTGGRGRKTGRVGADRGGGESCAKMAFSKRGKAATRWPISE